MGKKKNQKYGYLAVGLMLGIIVLFFANNWTTQTVYDFVSCSYNSFECEACGNCSDWNGVCTQEIRDQCCTPIRMCSGQIVSDPLDCYDKYCRDAGHWCKPVEQTDSQNYKCTCSLIETT